MKKEFKSTNVHLNRKTSITHLLSANLGSGNSNEQAFELVGKKYVCAIEKAMLCFMDI